MQTTKNLGLNLPDSEEFADIEKINENFEKLDEKVNTCVSTSANQGLSETEKANARANIGAGESGFSGSYSDLKNVPDEFQPKSHTHTKSDVGLGNVPNVSTNDQTPTYSEASSLEALTSGEKISVAFGKIKKAVSSLISHVNDKVSHITSEERTKWNHSNNTSVTKYHVYDTSTTDMYKIANIKNTISISDQKAGIDIDIPSEYLVTPEERELWESKTEVSVLRRYLGEGTKVATIYLKNTYDEKEHEIDIVVPKTGDVIISNNLTTSETGTALDAAQGKVLKDELEGLKTKTYTFGAGGDYENIVEGFWHIQQNSISNATIYIKSGTYDLISLITSFFGSNYISNYSLEVNDDGFHGLCLGNGNKVICEPGTVISAIYEGSNSKFSLGVAPFHAINDCFELHNCKIVCKGLRYCMHDDPNSAFGDCTSIIENCHFVNKKTAAGGCIGGGFSPYTKESKTIRNCTFEISDDVDYKCALYYHTNYNSDTSMITVDNCYAPDQFCFIGGTYTPIGKAVMNVNNSVFGKVPYKCQWYGGNPDDVEIYQYNNQIINSIDYSGLPVTADQYINAYNGELISLNGYCYIALKDLCKLTPGSMIKLLNINKECHVAFFNGTTYISGVADTDNFVIPDKTSIVYISFPIKYKDTIVVREYYDENSKQTKLSKTVLLNEIEISDTSTHTYTLPLSLNNFSKVAVIVKGDCSTGWVEVKEIDTSFLSQGNIIVSLYHSNAYNLSYQLAFSEKSVDISKSGINGFTRGSIAIHGIY